jgi:hypothetical protein
MIFGSLEPCLVVIFGYLLPPFLIMGALLSSGQPTSGMPTSHLLSSLVLIVDLDGGYDGGLYIMWY